MAKNKREQLFFIEKFNGVRKVYSYNMLSDGDLVEANNVLMDVGGGLRKRGGVRLIYNAVDTITENGKYKIEDVLGFHFFRLNSSQRMLIFGVSLSELNNVFTRIFSYRYDGTVNLLRISNNLANIDNSDPSQFLKKMDFVSYIGKLYIADGINKIMIWDGYSNVKPISDKWYDNEGNEYDNYVPKGGYVEVFNNRLFVAGDEKYPNTLYFSDYSNLDYFPSENFINIGSNDETITAIKKWKSYLLIFKENSIFMLTGSNREDFTVSPIFSNLGTVSPYSITSSDDGLYFFSNDGHIYLFTGQLEKISFWLENSEYMNESFFSKFNVISSKSDNFVLFSVPNTTKFYTFNSLTHDFTSFSFDNYVKYFVNAKTFMPDIDPKGFFGITDDCSLVSYSEEYLVDYTDVEESANIPVTIQTKPESMGSSFLKRFKFFYIDAYGVSSDIKLTFICGNVTWSTYAGNSDELKEFTKWIRLPILTNKDISVKIEYDGSNDFKLRTIGFKYYLKRAFYVEELNNTEI